MELIDLIDTHAHLDMPPLSSEPEEVMTRARSQGISQVITIGIDPESSGRAVDLARNLTGVYAAVGIHPHDALKTTDQELSRIAALAREQVVVAWGEIGLDFVKDYSPRGIQLSVFRSQLEMASAAGLPVIIHDRGAHEDVLEILQEYKGRISGVIHCFSGDIKVARKVLDLGFHLSVTGVVTFPKADDLREVVAYVPLDRLMLETDSPFLSPVPFRGKPNEPVRVLYVARKVAEIREQPLEEIARCTSENARALFALPSP